MTTLLLPGTSKTAVAIATHFHNTTSPPRPYLLGTRTSFPNNTYTTPTTPSSPSITHPTLTLSLTSPETWAPAFSTAHPPITTLYLAPPSILPDFVTHCTTFLSFAATHGISRIMLLSSSLVSRDGPGHGAIHAFLHDLARRTPGLEYAVLRPSWFAENWTVPTMLVRGIRGEGKVWSATGQGRVRWVAVEDIGGVGFEVLTREEGVGREGREYLVLGPEALSYDDVCGMVGEVRGREVVHVRMSVRELEEMYTGFGMPGETAGLLAWLDGELAKGAEERLGEGCVEMMLGRKGRTMREVLEKGMSDGVWG